MKSCQQHVEGLFKAAARKAFPSISHEPRITPSNPKFGDYQCSSAMSLFKQFGSALGADSPMKVGEKLKENLPKDPALQDVIVAPAGFVTVRLSNEWLSQQLQEVIRHGVSFKDQTVKRVVVDFSSPNIAKEMHVGHLRSTIIGEATSRILEFAGHEVHRLNHVGDWGTQFGMLIEFMREAFPTFQQEVPNISDLQGFYKQAKARFDQDAEFKTRAQKMVVALQSGDDFARQAWQLLCEISRREFKKIYDRLDVTLEERGESFYNEMISSLVKELEERGIIVKANGAMLFWTTVSEIPLIAVKTDGGFGYDSTDLAAIFHRLCVMRADWLIYITDLGQQDHFHMIFDAARLAGWHRPAGPVAGSKGDDASASAAASSAPAEKEKGKGKGDKEKEKEKEPKAKDEKDDDEEGEDDAGAAAAAGSKKVIPSMSPSEYGKGSTRLDHMGHGLVQGDDGKKFKTRSGEVVKLVELLDEGARRAEAELRKRRLDILEKAGEKRDLTAEEEKEIKEAAPKIGYAAVRYFDLRQNRTNSYVFSFDRMLENKGNTAVYMLYAYARICQIMVKAGSQGKEVDTSMASELTVGIDKDKASSVACERELALAILRFPDVMTAILEDLHIHRLAEYMYDLSGKFSNFYNNDDCKVVGSGQFEASRLLMCLVTQQTLHTCFSLLGISPLSRI
uniref:arginine--tRNA ligase n=1 Tax=Chromera velia CCMP2878 TaxID=1169474 RepID=A0A0G4GJL9_9ALVE|mmetsp:Transcript_12096/g.23350  ORF Transcript_12096/g.23350 Transcript_12096/m.23350 type:complete len:679 (+) Transcript_12096:126-2162(+)|eukprot:Cvel_22194.t1-p1 / transcript=Cvel_22194.t1 / gene=Cvel_22194 / organism=Chromera_velia_CCMP2878 / gene_product=Arginine--tRNA ligase, cytoplasmic, putative / transcript_product=Arginine--tRNA ligase, cytoplasmic, putative / location=Cvel_scaffold2156:3803-9042(+) / protein_length=678 / sequence_SO=supercontig / SO=protein_coding / is_pseudo=false